MNKRIILTSFSACMLISVSAFNQGNSDRTPLLNSSHIIELSQDSSIVPQDSLLLKKGKFNTKKSSRLSKYKLIEKEKERRKKMRDEYKKNKDK